MRIHPVFHVSLLEPHTANPFPSRLQELPPIIIIRNNKEYEVEEILDSKILRRRRLFYLVKWKGYPISDNSWEPAANVRNSRTLVQKFHSRYPSKPGPRTR